MSDPWDASLVDPTDQPRDVSMIRSPGGRSGSLSLENGAKLSFPWARQQKISGTYPGQIYVVDDATTEYIYMQSPTLNASGHRAQMYLAGWTDGTSSIGLAVNGGVTLTLASGQIYTSAHPFIANGTFTAAGAVTVNGAFAATSTSTFTGLITANGGINAGAAGGMIDLRGGAANDTVLTSNAARQTFVDGGTLTQIRATAGQLNMYGETSALLTAKTGLTLSSTNASTNVTISHGSGGYVDLNTKLRILNTTNLSALSSTTMGLSIGSKTGLELMASPNYIQSQNNGAVTILGLQPHGGAVQANGYPVVPLRQIGAHYTGSAPPAVSATDPQFKMQAGHDLISFTGGVGRITFPTAFANGVLAVVTNVRHDGDGFSTTRSGGTHNTSGVDLTLAVGGTFPTGSFYINWIAIGY